MDVHPPKYSKIGFDTSPNLWWIRWTEVSTKILGLRWPWTQYFTYKYLWINRYTYCIHTVLYITYKYLWINKYTYWTVLYNNYIYNKYISTISLFEPVKFRFSFSKLRQWTEITMVPGQPSMAWGYFRAIPGVRIIYLFINNILLLYNIQQ